MPDNMTVRMLPDKQWKFVQDSVPICCVDVLPFRISASKGAEIGLIWRDTPHQDRRWCFIGGRVFRNESHANAIARQLKETLGPKVRLRTPVNLQPLALCEYFSAPRKNALYDPRQHSVALLYSAVIDGTASPRGEGLKFSWFSTGNLPPASEIGFGQRKIMTACLKQLSSMGRSADMLRF
jgi:ADP-ribose pyrophosphatase YjhB (NUDIX family)